MRRVNFASDTPKVPDNKSFNDIGRGLVMRLAVIIATLGRREIAGRLLEELAQQDRLPDLVVLSVPDPSHLPDPIPSLPFPVDHVIGSRGSSAQRNAGIEHVLGHFDIVTFLDDDFIPARDYLELIEEAFRKMTNWVVVMGNVVEDGARNEGLSWDQGMAIVNELSRHLLEEGRVKRHVGAYGCNMSIRASAIGTLRFDERLVLYGWQEDIDFTSQLRLRGDVVGVDVIRGVHLGIKAGRVSGTRFGYSQVINPVYLVRKGTVPASFLVPLMLRNLAANLLHSIRPEPYIDRRGRLRGNLLALTHLLRGRIEPEYVIHL